MPELNNPNPTPAGDNPPATPPATPPSNPSGDDKGGESSKTIPKESYDIVAQKLREKTERLEALEKAAKDAEEKKMVENNQFKELAEKREQELNETKTKFATQAKSSALKIAAIQAGCVNPDDLAKLIDLGEVKLSEDGSVDQASITALIDKVKTEKAYLFGKPSAPTIGNNGGNPSNPDGGSKTFRRSQLADSKFFEDNKNDILVAMRNGKIIDDITPKR